MKFGLRTSPFPALPAEMHLSLLCRLKTGRPHAPCSGTCDRANHGDLDRGRMCEEPCECTCHDKAANPIGILASALRRQLAEGGTVIPELQVVMDGLMPGWRDDDQV